MIGPSVFGSETSRFGASASRKFPNALMRSAIWTAAARKALRKKGKGTLSAVISLSGAGDPAESSVSLTVKPPAGS